MNNFFVNLLYFWLPFVISFLALILAILRNLYKNSRVKFFQKMTYWKIIGFFMGFRLIYALFKTAVQYHIWEQAGGLSRFLLPPYRPISYFIGYSITHFWLSTLIDILIAAIFYAFLRLLKKYNSRFFEKDEPELGFLTALIVGWPNVVLIIPFAFIFVAILGILRGIFLKEQYTALSWPLIISAFIILFFGSYLINLFHLKTLVV